MSVSCSEREWERADSVAWSFEVEDPEAAAGVGWEVPVVIVVVDGMEIEELRIRLRRVVEGSGAVVGTDGAVIGVADGCWLAVDVDGVSSSTVGLLATISSTFVSVSRASSEVSRTLRGWGDCSPDALSSGVYMKISLPDDASSSPTVYCVALRIAMPSRHSLSAVICCLFCARSACSAFLRD